MRATFLALIATAISASCFQPERVSLTVEVDGPGRVQVLIDGNFDVFCSDVCSYSVIPDEIVTLGMWPEDSAIFLGWGGACSLEGTFNLCDLEPNERTLVTAKFSY